MIKWLFSRPLPVGTPAPPFILPDEKGHVFILNQQRGKNVIIIFYPGDETPVCRKQLCEVRDKWDAVTAKGAVVVGINPQTAESHARFRTNQNFPFPLLVDLGQRVAATYQCKGPIVRRTVYLVGTDGIIRFAKRGNPSIDEVLAAASSQA